MDALHVVSPLQQAKSMEALHVVPPMQQSKSVDGIITCLNTSAFQVTQM